MSNPTQLGPAPVSSPAQVAATSEPITPHRALPRTYDQIFDRHRGDIPIEYLRALVYSESRMNPRARSRSGARGLMQITPTVRLSFNAYNRARYQAAHLDDPGANVTIGCWLLRFIATSYAKNHPAIPNMRTDWRNPRFVELLTFGWNAGFTETRGVGLVVAHLEHKGAIDIDLDLVHGHARAAGAVEHIANPSKVAWCKRVAALYLRERALAEPLATQVA